MDCLQANTTNASCSEILDITKEIVEDAAFSKFDAFSNLLKKIDSKATFNSLLSDAVSGDEEKFKCFSFAFKSIEYTITCIKLGPEQYLKDIDEVKKSVEGLDEVEASDILRKWRFNLLCHLDLFYNTFYVIKRLEKDL